VKYIKSTYAIVAALLFGIFLGFMTMTIGGMVVAPQLFDHPDYGLSYFGAPGIAPVPYFTGIGVVVVCSGLLAYVLRTANGRLATLGRIFGLSALFTMAIAATSYPQGHFWYWTHIWICIVLAVIYLGAIVWIWWQRLGDIVAAWWTATFIGGAVILELSNSATRVLGLYAFGEVVMFVAILMLLGRATLKLVPTE
jgi:hypothetical protein